MKKKPTYKVPVSICAIVLVVGAIVLAVLMETREMAPPRKYEVDMSGEVIGIDNGPKIPVLTKEEEKDEEVKEEKKTEAPKKESSESEETADPENPVIVPNVPEGQTEPVVKAPVPEIKSLRLTRLRINVGVLGVKCWVLMVCKKGYIISYSRFVPIFGRVLMVCKRLYNISHRISSYMYLVFLKISCCHF